MSWITKKEKAEQRAKLVEDAGAILKKADEEKRELTQEENQEFEARHKDADKLLAEIETIERQEKAEATLNARKEEIGRNNPTEATSTVDKDTHSRAFGKWIRYGREALTPEERSSMATHTQQLGTEIRTASGLSATTSNEGAEFVAEDFSSQFIAKLQAYGGMREVSHSFATSTGAALPVPVLDDTSQTGEQLDENTATADDATNDPDTSSVTLNAYMYSSKVVRVPFQLLQDSAFPVESWLADALVKRIGKIRNARQTTGTGSSQAKGITVAASTGKTVASQTAVTYNELLDLKHSVDPAYRGNPTWMFKDATLLALKKLTDGNGNPLWNRGDVANSIPPTIDGDRYVINQDMPAMTAGLNAIAYGDFQNYWIRDVSGIQLLRLVERYAEYLQVGFIAFQRGDSDLVDTSAVKLITMAASS